MEESKSKRPQSNGKFPLRNETKAPPTAAKVIGGGSKSTVVLSRPKVSTVPFQPATTGSAIAWNQGTNLAEILKKQNEISEVVIDLPTVEVPVEVPIETIEAIVEVYCFNI